MSMNQGPKRIYDEWTEDMETEDPPIVEGKSRPGNFSKLLSLAITVLVGMWASNRWTGKGNFLFAPNKERLQERYGKDAEADQFDIERLDRLAVRGQIPSVLAGKEEWDQYFQQLQARVESGGRIWSSEIPLRGIRTEE